MVVFLAAAAGAILGSFLSVLVDRWPKWSGVLAGRSHCPHCKHELAWYDLIPLASWAVMMGKCRYCKARISAWYPVYEIVVAVAFGLLAWQIGGESLTAHWMWFALLFGFIALFFFDIRHMVLPDAILLPMAVMALVMGWQGQFLAVSIPSGLVLALFFGGLYRMSRGRWLGLGDVKMAVVVGLVFGVEALSITLVAIWAGALVGIGLIASGKATRQTPVPFGAFWAASAVVCLLWPEPFFALTNFFLYLAL